MILFCRGWKFGVSSLKERQTTPEEDSRGFLTPQKFQKIAKKFSKFLSWNLKNDILGLLDGARRLKRTSRAIIQG